MRDNSSADAGAAPLNLEEYTIQKNVLKFGCYPGKKKHLSTRCVDICGSRSREKCRPPRTSRTTTYFPALSFGSIYQVQIRYQVRVKENMYQVDTFYQNILLSPNGLDGSKYST